MKGAIEVCCGASFSVGRARRRPESADSRDALSTLAEGLVEVGRSQTAQGIYREGGRVDEPGKALPPQGPHVRVACRGQDGREQNIVQTQDRGTCQILGTVARRPDQAPPIQRSPCQPRKATRGQVQTVAGQVSDQGRGPIEQQARTVTLAESKGALGQIRVLCVPQGMGTELYQADTPAEGAGQAVQETIGHTGVLAGDQVELRQAQRRDDGTVRGGEGLRGHGIRMYPCHRLALATAWIAGKRGHAVHVEQDAAISVIVVNPDERTGREDSDTELLPELTGQSLQRRFPGLQLPAGEFPQTALVDGFGPLGDQNPPLGIFHCPGGNMNLRCPQVRYSALMRT
jgi:hypothetical protein